MVTGPLSEVAVGVSSRAQRSKASVMPADCMTTVPSSRPQAGYWSSMRCETVAWMKSLCV